MERIKQSGKEYLSAFNNTGNFVTKEENVIENNLYTQNRFRFLLGCFWECFLLVVILGSFVVSIGCLVTADQEADDGEWLQILVGILIMIVFIPLMCFLIVFLPHFFISAIKIETNGIVVPRSILLLRNFISFTDLHSLSIDTNGNVVVQATKNYMIPNSVVGLSQLLWYIHTKHSGVECDEFVLRRISRWEDTRNTENAALL